MKNEVMKILAKHVTEVNFTIFDAERALDKLYREKYDQELAKKDAEIARLNDALECSEDVEILKSENAHLKDERLSILREIEEDAICYYDVLQIFEKYNGEK